MAGSGKSVRHARAARPAAVADGPPVVHSSRDVRKILHANSPGGFGDRVGGVVPGVERLSAGALRVIALVGRAHWRTVKAELARDRKSRGGIVSLRAKRNYSSCRFWEPALENASRGLPMVGSCEAAKTGRMDTSSPARCWPASAVGGDGAELLTLSSFSCAGWQRSIPAGPEAY